MAPKFKTKVEMFPLVEDWLNSGLTQKQFCMNYQLPVYILAYWVSRYRKAQPDKATTDNTTMASKAAKTIATTDSSSGFIRLASPPQTTALPTVQLPAATIEVVLPTGTVIRFSTTVPAGYLKELLSICSL